VLNNKLNQAIEEHLQKQAKENHISHAYILNGENVQTSLQIAENLAQTLTKSKADILYFTHEKPNLISVDEIRVQINQSVFIKPYDSAYKVYIVQDAEKMNAQAQNALLKTLEEPPLYVVILLITRNSESFLQTILSRCVKLNIFEEQENEESISEDETAISDSLKRFMMSVPNCDEQAMLNFVDEMTKEKDFSKEMLEKFRLWFRDALIYKGTSSIKLLYFQNDAPIVKGIANAMSFAGINQVLEKITSTQNRIDANVNFELSLETLIETVFQEVRKNK